MKWFLNYCVVFSKQQNIIGDNFVPMIFRNWTGCKIVLVNSMLSRQNYCILSFNCILIVGLFLPIKKQMLRVLSGNIAHRSPLWMSESPFAMQQAMLRSSKGGGGLYNQCCPQPLLMFVYYQIICSNINSTHCRMVFCLNELFLPNLSCHLKED